MPQASAELTEEWDGPGDQKAIGHLVAAGYRLTSAWEWQCPRADYTPTGKDRSAAQFLIDEWDYGGIIPPPGFRSRP